MFLMILTGGFDGFDVLTAGFDVFDGCILNHVIHTEGFEDAVIRKFPSTCRIPYQHIWGCAVKNCEVHPPQTSVLFKTKDQAYISPLTPEAKVRENFKTIKSEYIIYKRVQK